MAPSIITKLRDFVPIRPLTREQAFRIAELQAIRFRVFAGITDPVMPESAIAEIPKIQIERMSPLAVSGATAWSNGRWMILLRGSEPWGRQRFSLAHEFKHILDHRFIDVLYERIPERHRHDFVEQVCDYFAGCLLMPRLALKQAWYGGMQDPAALAEHFSVSQPAIQTRLAQVGLTERQSRCGVANANWTLPPLKSADSSSASYQRRTHPAYALTLEGAPS